MIQSNSLWGGDGGGGGGGVQGQQQQGGKLQHPAAQWLFGNLMRQQMGPGLRAMPGQQPQIPYRSIMDVLYGGQGFQGMDKRKRGRFGTDFGIQPQNMGL